MNTPLPILAIGDTATFTKPDGTQFTGTVEGRNWSFERHTGYIVNDGHRHLYHANPDRETGYSVRI